MSKEVEDYTIEELRDALFEGIAKCYQIPKQLLVFDKKLYKNKSDEELKIIEDAFNEYWAKILCYKVIEFTDKPNVVDNNVMLHQGKKYFHCNNKVEGHNCNCNVFTQYDNQTYKCHSCGKVYHIEEIEV